MNDSFFAMFDVTAIRHAEKQFMKIEQMKMKEKMKAKEIIEDELTDEEIDFSEID